jgi:hypothetical protein
MKNKMGAKVEPCGTLLLTEEYENQNVSNLTIACVLEKDEIKH